VSLTRFASWPPLLLLDTGGDDNENFGWKWGWRTNNQLSNFQTQEV